MQNFSEVCQLTISDDLTRSLTAALDITPGDVILEEVPLFMCPHWESDHMKCSNCLKDSFVMCSKCLVFPMCIECGEHDRFDCEFFQRADKVSKNFLISNYAVYGPLKCLLLLENPLTRNSGISDLLKMDPHLEDYRQSDSWEEQMARVVQPLIKSGIGSYLQNVEMSEEFLERVCSIIDLNSYEITNKDGDLVKGIYLRASTIPHSCIPNTMMAVDDDFNLKIYATLPIAQGEQIYTSYANPLMGTSQRQHHLQITKYITCSCPRCRDPTELGTYLSSVKCKSCPDGYVSLTNSKWICEKCASTMEELEVQKLLSEVAEQLLYADGDIQQYEGLLDKYAADFHPNHFLIIDMKQNIASILRAVLMNPMCKPGKNVLRRKIVLCEELLPVVRTVLPGISRLYAIALYEFVITFVELTGYEFSDGEISAEEYRSRLMKALQMSKEAIEMLAYEPKNSPEGHLMQRIEMEMRQIEENLSGSEMS